MEAAASGMVNLFSPSLGPALMISMGYIDLGKWLATVEAGAQFGYDLVLLALFFNLTAILCQYLATCIGTVTGKDLAQLCSEEYSRPTCMILGVQAEVSMMVSELTTIMGIAHGLNSFLGVGLSLSVCFATMVVTLLPFLVTLVKGQVTEAFYVTIAGFVLVFYILGVLTSHPEMPLTMNIFSPNLSGDNAYLLMALLGTNVMAHNFYVHSSIVHQQKQAPSVHIGALFHDHFFAILFIFTGISLTNYVLMNSAAVVFSGTDVALNFQDLSILMDQIFRNHIAPIGFFLVLLFSSQITALTWSIGGKLIVQHFFGANLSVHVHNLLVKSFSVISAFYYAKSSDTEGVYELLILCQVVQAMFLPSSVIPLFRVASSRLIMGTFRMAWYLEILSLLAFLGMLGSNIIFITEMLFGNSSWTDSIGGTTGNTRIVLYVALIVVACASTFFTLYLAVTPLKSVSERTDTELWIMPSQKDQHGVSEQAGDNETNEVSNDENNKLLMESSCDSPMEIHQDKSMLEFKLDQPDVAVDSDQDFYQSNDSLNVVKPLMDCPEEPKSIIKEDLEVDEVSAASSSDPDIVEKNNVEDVIDKDSAVEAHVCSRKDSQGIVEPHVSPKGVVASFTSEDSGFVNVVKEKCSDTGNGSESLSKFSGLGRAARRQFAAILDEFWENLFDFHGKLTQEANNKQFGILLGIDLKVAGSSVNVNVEMQSSKHLFMDSDKETIPKPMEYGSLRQKVFPNRDLAYAAQMGLTSWSQNTPRSNSNLYDSSSSPFASRDELHSNVHQQQYLDYSDYQPATIHGYQIASYLKTIGSGRTHMSQDPWMISKPGSSPSQNLRDSVIFKRGGQNGLNVLEQSGFQSSIASQLNKVQVGGPYHDASSFDLGENVSFPSCTKKYHSSPDISAIISATRNSLLNEAKWGSPIVSRPPPVSMASEQSQYISPISKTGVSLPFNELSQHKAHRDVFSLHQNLSSDTRSLWSKQPFEQLFGVTNRDQIRGPQTVSHRSRNAPPEVFSYSQSESKLLQALRFCILKLLKLEGSDWLFGQNGGYDEELINRVAVSEKFICQGDDNEMNNLYSHVQYQSSDQKIELVNRKEGADVPCKLSLPNCGDSCIWRSSLVASFGVWCVRRILDMSLVESRPELWGKYTYVLNRLQGILNIAFLKPRHPINICSCLEVPAEDMKIFNHSMQTASLCKVENPIKGSFTTATMILEIIKDVEIAISGRKGRTGTAAGDIAFPKGKENLASVLKRYKRRLLNKPTGTLEDTPSRRIPSKTVF